MQEIYYMCGKPKKVDNTTSTAEVLALEGKATADESTMHDLTQDGGPLCAGALPHVETGGADGDKSLWESLAGSTVGKPKTRKKEKDEAEVMVPKTIKEYLD